MSRTSVQYPDQRFATTGGWARECVAGNAQQVQSSDNGIDPVQQEHLFERLHRLGRPTSSPAGVGLGLVVPRQFGEAMQGRLPLRSAPRQSRGFTVLTTGAPSGPSASAQAAGAP